MRNKYPGLCRDCGAIVIPGAGFFEKRRGRPGFDVRCITCVAKGKLRKGAFLTFAQEEALRNAPPET